MIKLIVLAVFAALSLPASAAAKEKTYILAPDRSGSLEVHRLERPRGLVLGPLGGSLAETMWLQRIKWRGWGKPNATATAKHRTKTFDPWENVKVRAFRRRSCAAQPRYAVYTRIKTTAYGRTITWKMPSCGDVDF